MSLFGAGSAFAMRVRRCLVSSFRMAMGFGRLGVGFVMLAFSVLVSGGFVRCGCGTVQFGGLCVTFFCHHRLLDRFRFPIESLAQPIDIGKVPLRRWG